MNYWLLKTEPSEFSIDDLQQISADYENWDGIRNYQARNIMRDDIKVGDKAFIYHSSCKDVGVAGVAEVVKAAFPDPLQFDAKSKYYDPKSKKEAPRWVCVGVKFVEKFDAIVPLKTIKETAVLKEMVLVNRGRLSVQPVRKKEWQTIVKLAKSQTK